MGDNNIWSNEWPPGEDWSGGGSRSKRLPRGSELGASLYELGPDNWVPFHFHHGSEELLLVLRGRPTLRTADGSRELEEGEAVHFPAARERLQDDHLEGSGRDLVALLRHIESLCQDGSPLQGEKRNRRW